MAGLAAVVETVAMPSEPSGADFAVSLAPTAPPPPALFSTITGLTERGADLQRAATIARHDVGGAAGREWHLQRTGLSDGPLAPAGASGQASRDQQQ